MTIALRSIKSRQIPHKFTINQTESHGMML